MNSYGQKQEYIENIFAEIEEGMHNLRTEDVPDTRILLFIEHMRQKFKFNPVEIKPKKSAKNNRYKNSKEKE